MKATTKHLIALMLLALPATMSAQKDNSLVALTDSASAQHLKKLNSELAALEIRLQKQESKLNADYPGVAPAAAEQQQMREDSLYLTLLSQKTTLLLRQKEIKQKSMRRLANTLNKTNATTPSKK